MKQPIVLRIFKGDKLYLVKQSTDTHVTIGRDEQIVNLPGDATAPLHASIQENDGTYWLMDLGSETGTRRNGTPVLESQIESGDIIEIGDYRIEFFIGAPRSKAFGETTGTAIPVVAPPIVVVPPPVVAPPIVAPKAMPAPDVRKPSVGAAPIAPPITSPMRRPAPAWSTPKHSEKRKRWGRTFAPASRYSEVTDYVKPGKGAVVEVLVAWQERIIRTYHFNGARLITAGPNPTADVSIPLKIGGSDKTPILRMDGQAVVLTSAAASGEMISGTQITPLAMLMQQRGLRAGAQGSEITLAQGEMIRLNVHDQISLIIRYTSDAPRPLMAPALDLTASESVGLIMAFVMTGILWLYMFLYTLPVSLTDQANDEPLRQALIIVTPPKPPAPKEPVPETTPPPLAKMTPTPKKTTTEAAKKALAKQETTPSENKPKGAAQDVAPKPTKTKVKEMTSVKQGGAVKVGKTEGAQMQSPKKDVTKSGVFSVFGNSGKNADLSQATSGAGELAGMANAATGKAGSAEDRAGDTLGAKMKDTGAGGKGVAQVGVPGVQTKGRGGGDSGFGEGGLGGRKGVSIIPGGSGESFTPGYDKEAVRRVIQENINAIRACYERELNRSPDLQGKIVLQWSIGAGGRVTTASVKSNDMGNAKVGQCIADRLRTLTFPDPPTANEVDVAFPFVFKN